VPFSAGGGTDTAGRIDTEIVKWARVD